MSSMWLPRCPVSSVKTGQDMVFPGHVEGALGRVLGQVPGIVLNSSLGTVSTQRTGATKLVADGRSSCILYILTLLILNM